MVAGVCGGVGESLHIDPVIVRIVFALLLMAGGAGLLLYAAGWALLPEGEGGEPAVARLRLSLDGSDQVQRLLGVALLASGALLALREIGLWLGDALMWPLALGAMGAAVMWRQDAGGSVAGAGGGRAAAARVGAGVVLVAGAVWAFLAANDVADAARPVLAAMASMVAGLGLIFGPWAWRLTNELVEERRRRIRADERSELARMVHDSVLQTLTLIQRHATDPTEVTKLARRQERELRSVLYGVGAPDGDSLTAAMEAAAAEVEDLHGVPVEVVAVGDCPIDERLAALVLAAREALVNGAKFSEAPTLSLYVEVEPERVTVFVRDRGKGFDPETVPDDRRGIAESIRGRLERQEGTAVLRTAPGEGTEWELSLARERART